MPQEFGGAWTEEKLTRLKKYLERYLQIFTVNPRARHFRTIYVDGFAGSGRRLSGSGRYPATLLASHEEASAYRQGSAEIALRLDPGFDRYVFVEKQKGNVEALNRLLERYPDKAGISRVHRGDANQVLSAWCETVDTRRERAVVFLDPYGLQVRWEALAALADTQAVDLWLLFPLGQAVNRLLTSKKLPAGGWADRLTTIFGTDEWKTRFYTRAGQSSFLGSDAGLEKSATFKSILEYWQERLASVFTRVAPHPRILRNSRNNPIFVLCFAASNPQGAPTAVRIADYLLTH